MIHSIRTLFLNADLPMNLKRGTPTMQVTVTISDAIVREAGVRGLPVIDFVESLIDKGMSAAQGRPVLDSAMERIRALRQPTTIEQASKSTSAWPAASLPGGRCSSRADRLIGLLSQCLLRFGPACKSHRQTEKDKKKDKKRLRGYSNPSRPQER